MKCREKFIIVVLALCLISSFIQLAINALVLPEALLTYRLYCIVVALIGIVSTIFNALMIVECSSYCCNKLRLCCLSVSIWEGVIELLLSIVAGALHFHFLTSEKVPKDSLVGAMKNDALPFFVAAYANFVQAFLCLVLIITNLVTKSREYRKGIIEKGMEKAEMNETELEGRKNEGDEISLSEKNRK